MERSADDRAVPVIGLTGGIGSGKSMVARQFASLGCGVIDADALARQAFEDPEVRQALAAWWGQAVFDASGQVDRRAVSRRVFDDPESLEALESLVHPKVAAGRAARRAALAADPQVVAIVEDCPLLIEKGIDASCDVVVFVAASIETRLERVHRTRGWDAEELLRREKNQRSLDAKAERADYVVTNDADAEFTMDQVRRVLSEILHPPTDS